MSYARMVVIGNLGKDCTVNTVNGKNVINFTVAHSTKYKDRSGNNVEKTLWVDCAYWTDRVGVANYLKKGTQVFAAGSPDVRTYQDQQGNTHATIVVRVAEVQLLGGSKANQPGANAPVTPPASETPTNNATPPGDGLPTYMDDLPF